MLESAVSEPLPSKLPMASHPAQSQRPLIEVLMQMQPHQVCYRYVNDEAILMLATYNYYEVAQGPVTGHVPQSYRSGT